MWQWTSITVCPSVVEAQPNVEWRRGSHDANGPGPERPTPERVGCVYSVGSGCAGVFVDQAAESVWQFASHMRTTLVLDALRMALHQRQPGADVALVHHSDAGSQG